MPKIVNVEEKKHEIYKAATSVFLEKGYVSTTLGDIAKAGKLGRSTVYQYFRNKEEIFHGVAITFFSELVSSMDEIFSRDLSATGKLKEMLRVFIFETQADSKRFFQLAKVLLFLRSSSPVFEQKFRLYYLSVQDIFYQVIENGMESGAIKKWEPQTMSVAVFGLAQSILLQSYLNNQTNNTDYFEAICMMIDGIQGEKSHE